VQRQPNLCSIKQFCADHGISRSLFYKLIQQGRGPRITKLGARTLVSAEACSGVASQYGAGGGGDFVRPIYWPGLRRRPRDRGTQPARQRD
jgi:hypothetical protein